MSILYLVLFFYEYQNLDGHSQMCPVHVLCIMIFGGMLYEEDKKIC